ncbi:hypothetical protein ACJJIG_17655 [Microbulbifer sp. SSSA007]|uniref:hypothetical protein n=1 Tax=Microbulbifer sp. SSSA007 TaxID=3243379 RepID=UPI0040399161
MNKVFLCMLILSWSIIAKATDQSSFKGYLVYDEEWVGFYHCGSDVYGLDDSSDLDIYSMYQKEKSGFRKLLYVELIAEVTNIGIYTFGLSSPPRDINLRITKIIKTEKHDSPKCSIASEATIITTYDEAPDA